MEQTILIVGMTSALVASIPLSFFENRTVIALVRKQTTESERVKALVTLGVTVTTDEKDALDAADVMLFASTHDGSDLLERFKGDSLYISSGALTDVELGLMKANGYTNTKTACEAHATMSLRPGYYIPFAGSRDTGRGLHRENGFYIFGAKDAPEDYNWSKAYYVTPMGPLVEYIMQWLTDSNTRKSGSYSFGTTRAYTREELNNGGSDAKGEPIYKETMARTKKDLGIWVDEEQMPDICAEAREWYAKI